jgi:hypothetical protein
MRLFTVSWLAVRLLDFEPEEEVLARRPYPSTETAKKSAISIKRSRFRERDVLRVFMEYGDR